MARLVDWKQRQIIFTAIIISLLLSVLAILIFKNLFILSMISLVFGLLFTFSGLKGLYKLSDDAYLLAKARRNIDYAKASHQRKYQQMVTDDEDSLANFYRQQQEAAGADFFDEELREEELFAENKQSILLPECFKYFGFNSIPSEDELKSTYRKMAKNMHPDKGGDPDEFVRMNRIYDEAVSIIRNSYN